MNSLLKIRNIFFDSWFGLLFLMIGIAIQCVAYQLTNSSILSLVSGISGIFAVVLCSQRKYIFYAFAWCQLITYVILAYEQKLYGEIIENIFYAITMIGGMFMWLANYDNKNEQVIARQQKPLELLATFILMLVVIYIFYSHLNLTDDTQPFLDSATTVPAFIAQMLMIMRYREQWIFWLIIDIGSILMWIHAGDWCMVAQFVFWTANCIYGFYKWSK
jgi:nicotinamide mononucleotide transporter